MGIRRSPVREVYFWLVWLIVLSIIVLSVVVFRRWLFLHIMVGPFLLHHWMSWTGATFIAVYTPVYSLLKHRKPGWFKILYGTHVLGNLVAVLLISAHFSQHAVGPDFGTGIVLYTTLVVLAITGIMRRFRLLGRFQRQLRFIHVSTTLTFYFIVIFHVLHGLEVF